MFKRIISLFISLFICLFTFVPTFAVETTEEVTISGLSDFLNEYTTTQADTSVDISISEVTDNISEPYIPDDTDVSTSDEASVTESTSSGEPSTFYNPVTNPETEDTVDTTVGRIAFSFTGLKSDFVLIVKNTDTGKKYEIELTENSGFYGTAELEPGHYKISKLKGKSDVVSAGNIKDSEGKRFKEFDVKGGDMTVYNLSCIQIVTLGILPWIKQRFVYIIIFAIIVAIYLYVRKNKPVPGKIGG